MMIGIDASNISQGGGVTHLVELLKSMTVDVLNEYGVVVWGSPSLLNRIQDMPGLVKKNLKIKGLVSRLTWQLYGLQRSAKQHSCGVVLVPGGCYFGWFSPVVTMSQNMLPFEWHEMRRFGFSKSSLRLILLRFMQAYSFRRAAGMIFLTAYAKRNIMKIVTFEHCPIAVIPHGVGQQFSMQPRIARSIESCSYDDPFRLLYVSFIAPYKHQDTLASVIAQLRAKKIPVVLDLIGPVDGAGKKILQALKQIDPEHLFIRHHGEVPYTKLHEYYEKADLCVFASSCENLPIILLEAMAAGLAIACSNRGPMPELLGNNALYFDPENKAQLEAVLYELIMNPDLRSRLAQQAFEVAQAYTWSRCAKETFQFLIDVALTNQAEVNKSLIRHGVNKS